MLVDLIFTKMTARYGSMWIERWRGISATLVRQDWLQELEGISVDEVAFGLRYLPSDRPPTVTEFRAICHRAPRVPEQRPALDGPRPDPGRVRAELQRLRDAITRRPPRQWIEDLLERERSGEQLSIGQRLALSFAMRAPALANDESERARIERAKLDTARMVARYLREHPEAS